METTEGLRIVATGRAVPEHAVANDDLKAYMDTSDEWIFPRTGIHERRYCDLEKGECVTELAIAAAQKVIEKAKETREDFSDQDIGAVIAACCTADYMFPSIASLVQGRLGLRRDMLAFDLNAACSGFIFGLATARGLLLDGKRRYVLLVCAEQLSKFLDLNDRGTSILFGDGAAAVLLELDKGEDSLPFYVNTFSDGDIDSICCGGAGGGTLCSGRPKEKQVIHMDGHEVFRFAVAALEESVNDLLLQSGCQMQDVDYVLCHQANIRIINHVARKHPGFEDRFLTNIEHYGNTSSASIPILLDEMLENGTIKPGMRLMCVAFGAGHAWGGAFINL